MAENKPRSEGLDPRTMLADIDGTSAAMVSSTEVPRSFMFILLALMTTVVALLGVVSWPMIFVLCALFIPLGIWWYLLMRRRAKPRPILKHSWPYIGYVFLLMLVLQFSRFWEVGEWGEVGVKWLVLFGILGFCMSGMRTAAIKNRLKDANERPL